MKTYKIKSFIFFLLFVAAALFYNSVEQEEKFQNQIVSGEIVDLDPEKFEDSGEIKTPAQ